jgi:hypothetical protein
VLNTSGKIFARLLDQYTKNTKEATEINGAASTVTGLDPTVEASYGGQSLCLLPRHFA